MAMKVKEIIKLLEDDGWHFKRQSGSHFVYRHSTKSGIVVVPDHGMNSAIELYLEEAHETGFVVPMPKTISTVVEVKAA